MQDYLKVIWTSQEWDDTPVSSRVLAERLGVSPSTVSESLKRLAAQGLVDHERYGAVSLTDDGRAAALAMVRRHRLVETFLVDYLGYAWDEVHDEAEVLEHAVSDEFVERLSERLGHPRFDPHGDPIPTADGEVPALDARRLVDVEAPADLRVVRVSDDDPALLRHLVDLGLVLGARPRLVERHDYAGTLAVELEGRALDVGHVAAAAIFVSPV
jgi:DtxR family Mn-dependent transcriptional regulator